MNITKNIINDLFPLYVANECSPDTRALVEEYLKSNPGEAAELQKIMNATTFGAPLSSANLDEVRALREARRRVRRRSWLMGFAIFFSLMPMSFVFDNGKLTWWMVRDAPLSAVVYGAIGVTCWIAYAAGGRRYRSL